MQNKGDVAILRELAKQAAEIAEKEIQTERKNLWRNHNAFSRVRPPVIIRGGYEMELIRPLLKCEDDFCRGYESNLRGRILQDTFGDDTIIHPWINVRAAFDLPPEGVFGIPQNDTDRIGDGSLAFHIHGSLKNFDEMSKMVTPYHRIDEEKTKEDADKLREMIGDIIEIYVDRSPVWRGWNGDISTQLGYLRGHEQMLYDMHDHPDELHKLLKFMTDGVLKAQAEAEQAGDWTLADHDNQVMNYENSLGDPDPKSGGVSRKKLWGYFAAQEFASVSPAQHVEFLLNYQIPIMENFAITAYGCCEDLTNKIGILRKVKNLRRIAVTPFADAKKCAEQIGGDYVVSYRPNPNLATGYFGDDEIAFILKRDMGHFADNGCFVDICLKDISTTGGDPLRLNNFTRIAKEIAENYNA